MIKSLKITSLLSFHDLDNLIYKIYPPKLTEIIKIKYQLLNLKLQNQLMNHFFLLEFLGIFKNRVLNKHM